MKIYTRTGDSGSTSLFGGKRVPKSDARVEAYGTIDELNGWIGLILSRAAEVHEEKTVAFLTGAQSDLFTIGSTIAGWSADLAPLEKRITEMEALIDRWDVTLPALNNFILPTGTPLAALIHITRSICRRAERQAVALSGRVHVDPRVVKYLNRLSDLFFVLARIINKRGNVGEVIWSGIPRKSKNRSKVSRKSV